MSLSQLLQPLSNERRVLFNVAVQPVQGHRFQPTGFPDLGAATYQAPSREEGKENESISCLLVESAQSMANRMEQTIWDTGRNELTDAAKGLSYIRVLDVPQQYLTSSITESHRLNSAYIMRSDDDKFITMLNDELKKFADGPLDRQAILKTLFQLDANSLLHGAFLTSKAHKIKVISEGRIRFARALSSFIEAEHTQVVASGGVKNDHVQPGKTDERDASGGFGNVPFPREEYTARQITAYFSLDLAQIRGYGLDDAATQLLIVLGLYKIRALLDGDLRLRTACDFEVKSAAVKATKPKDFTLPSLKELEDELENAVAACARKKLFAGDKGVTTVTYKPTK